ncbi:MAG TPA: hypothetical protein VLB45_00610 [Nitrosopumilaceae archaeon]|nr:hypothetical protein [Nitrosopumilaceae archaeon]
MAATLYKGILVAILLVCSTFSVLTTPEVRGADELVTVDATNHGDVTVVEYKNSQENIFDVKSVVLEIDKGGNFKSFKTEKGWVGKRTSDDTITFTSTIPIKPGQSAKFGIKTDKTEPVFKWKAYDEEGDELGSGGEITTSQPKENTSGGNTQNGSSGVLDGATFRLIPSTPKVDTSLRIIGEGFAPSEKLDFYIDNNRIDSFVSDENGNFILSTKIPENQKADRADFIIKDQAGNQKSMSLRIEESSKRVGIQDIELTITGDKVFYRGEEKTISGTAEPGATLTISISDSSGQVLTSFTEKADSLGKYAIKHRVPADRAFGEYTITITDGKSTVSHTYAVETTQKIILATTKQRYDPGETIVINGTALPDQEIEIIIEDPVGMEAYSKNMVVGSNGIVNLEYPLEVSAREGTYVIFATQGDQHETFVVGVGEIPEIQLIARMSAINYKTTEQAVIFITGPPSSTVSLVLVDPSDKQKFADTITVGADGYAEYSFGLTSYSPGVYTAVLSRGNAQVEEKFSVGLQTGSGPITLRTVRDTFSAGETILIIGESNPNIIITVTFKDPNGTKIKSADLFTDKKGTFTSNAFKFPSDAKPGIWVLDAVSGLNHVTKEITLTTGTDGELAVWVDRSPPTYDNDQIVTITGSGAGQSHNIIIDIFGADQSKVESLSIVATGTGGFSTLWKVPISLNAGTYTIKVIDATKTAEITITVQ